MSLFTKSGKPIAKRFEGLYSLARDSFKRLSEKHKKALISYAYIEDDVHIFNVVFTSKSTVEITYSVGVYVKTEKCLFDAENLEFHTMPIHITSENRYEDFRSKSCLELILKLEYHFR